MLNRIKQIKQNKDGKVLVQNFAYLSLLQKAGYVFPLITMPYMARVIGVDGFGKIAFASAVYGPYGRPDMAYFGFTNKLLKGDKIQIFNYGNCKRDFTYVDDIVEGVVRIMQHAPEKENGEDGLLIPPYKVYNIGNNSPENLLDFV